MTRQHQVAATPLQMLDRARIMGQQNTGYGWRQIGKRAVQIAFTAPKILNSRQIQMLTAASELYCFILQYTNALISQSAGHRAVQVLIAANAQGSSHGKIMIAQNGVHSKRRVQSAQHFRYRLEMTKAFVNKIAGQNHDI